MRNNQASFAGKTNVQSISNAKARVIAGQPSLGRMFSDLCMVAIFAAMVPGCLWLGNAAGF